MDHARGDQPHVEVPAADREEAEPREEHVMLVQPGRAAPERVPRARARAAREAVEPTADQVARRVAGEAVAGERSRAREEEERPDAEPVRRPVARRFDVVPTTGE